MNVEQRDIYVHDEPNSVETDCTIILYCNIRQMLRSVVFHHHEKHYFIYMWLFVFQLLRSKNEGDNTSRVDEGSQRMTSSLRPTTTTTHGQQTNFWVPLSGQISATQSKDYHITACTEIGSKRRNTIATLGQDDIPCIYEYCTLYIKSNVRYTSLATQIEKVVFA